MGSVVSGIGGAVDNVLGSNIFGPNATDRAINSQTQATAQANQELAPYRQAGAQALGNLGKLTMDPGYQFGLDEGLRAVNANAAARGMGNSGATLKALTRFANDYATTKYNDAFSRQFNLANLGANAGTQVANNYLNLGNANAAAQIGTANRQSQLLGQGIGAIGMASTGGLAAFSDRRLKSNITPVDPADLAEMRRHLRAYAFQYIADDFGSGDWIGVMAQDLEKSKLGRTLVFEDSQGRKQIDLKKVLTMFLATLAEG